MSNRDTLAFELTEEHITLLKGMWVEWDSTEYGAPAIDPKRPYGNSYVPGDIAETLNWDVVDPEDGLTQVQKDAARKLHEETRVALQIVLQNLPAVKAGTYVRKDEYDYRWQLKAADSDGLGASLATGWH